MESTAPEQSAMDFAVRSSSLLPSSWKGQREGGCDRLRRRQRRWNAWIQQIRIMNKVTLFLWTTLKDAKNNDPTVQADKQGVNTIGEDVVDHLMDGIWYNSRTTASWQEHEIVNKIFEHWTSFFAILLIYNSSILWNCQFDSKYRLDKLFSLLILHGNS